MHRQSRDFRLSRRSVVAASAGVLAMASAGRTFAADALYWPEGASWETIEPAAAGFNPGKLASATTDMLAADSDTVLVLRKGRIAAELYKSGSTATSAYELASAAKSVLSVLVGIAIDLGKIKSVDQKAYDFIPQWVGTPKDAITIRHLLTMTSGVNFEGLKVRNIDGDQFAINAAASLKDAPGTHWAYNTPMFHLLYHVVERAVGEPFANFAQRVLLGPIGVQNWSWLTNQGHGENGPVTNYYSASCSARDLARFGLFALRGGRWKDRQLVDAAYFKASISPSQTLNPAYGYLWWENAGLGYEALSGGGAEHIFGDVPADTFGALGFGGQVAIQVPSLDLVVVRQGPLIEPRHSLPSFIAPIVAAVV